MDTTDGHEWEFEDLAYWLRQPAPTETDDGYLLDWNPATSFDAMEWTSGQPTPRQRA